MEDIERLSKDANLAYYEMVNSNKHQPLTKETIEKDINMHPDLSNKIRKYENIDNKSPTDPLDMLHLSPLLQVLSGKDVRKEHFALWNL